jgi:hypothetical protein
MTPRHLHKRDPEQNMTRFDRVDVAATLFGEASVVRSRPKFATEPRLSCGHRGQRPQVSWQNCERPSTTTAMAFRSARSSVSEAR